MRLIDADVLPVKFWFGRFFGVAEIDIVNAPTVDAVEVVRCKDCIHYWKNYPTEVAVCLASPRDDAYCSEGERKEDETN